MTPEQLEALIWYIDERAKHEAAAFADNEWPTWSVREAEKALRAAFQSPTVGAKHE